MRKQRPDIRKYPSGCVLYVKCKQKHHNTTTAAAATNIGDTVYLPLLLSHLKMLVYTMDWKKHSSINKEMYSFFRWYNRHSYQNRLPGFLPGIQRQTRTTDGKTRKGRKMEEIETRCRS